MGITKELSELGKEAYRDLAQPAAQEVGWTLGALARIVLAPVRRLVDGGHDRITQFLDRQLGPRLERIPPDRLVEIPARLALPAIQGAAELEDDEDTLREMFANLLASGADRDTTSLAHPSFAHVIRQMTADEARLLAFLREHGICSTYRLEESLPTIKTYGQPEERVAAEARGFFRLSRVVPTIADDAGCKAPEGEEAYVQNLVRLQLVQELRQPGTVDAAPPQPVKDAIAEVEREGVNVHAEPVKVAMTAYGVRFCRCCIPLVPRQ